MSFTNVCVLCQNFFDDAEEAEKHYQSEWHRCNSKRQLRDVHEDPISETSTDCKRMKMKQSEDSDYSENKLEHYEYFVTFAEEEENDCNPGPSNIFKSNPCDKEEKMETGTDTESINSDELEDWVENAKNPVVNNSCLFCDRLSHSLQKNLRHMQKAHSFFIPNQEYCIDAKGLLEYLGEKVFDGYLCLWCNDKGEKFKDAASARTHMMKKGHCKMLYEGEALQEYEEFYSFPCPPRPETIYARAGVEITELDDSIDYQLHLPPGNSIEFKSCMDILNNALLNTGQK